MPAHPTVSHAGSTTYIFAQQQQQQQQQQQSTATSTTSTATSTAAATVQYGLQGTVLSSGR